MFLHVRSCECDVECVANSDNVLLGASPHSGLFVSLAWDGEVGW